MQAMNSPTVRLGVLGEFQFELSLFGGHRLAAERARPTAAGSAPDPLGCAIG